MNVFKKIKVGWSLKYFDFFNSLFVHVSILQI